MLLLRGPSCQSHRCAPIIDERTSPDPVAAHKILGGFFASHFLGCFYSSHCFGCFYSSVLCLSLSIGWLNSVVCCRSSRKSWWLSTAMEMRMGRQSKGGAFCGERRRQGCSFNARVWSRISNSRLIGREVWRGVEGRRRCFRLLSSNPDLLL